MRNMNELMQEVHTVDREIAGAFRQIYDRIDLGIPAQRRVADRIRSRHGLPPVGVEVARLAIADTPIEQITARQANITQEIAEVTGGAEAMK